MVRSRLVELAESSVLRHVWAAEMKHSMWLSLKQWMKIEYGLMKHSVRIWWRSRVASARSWPILVFMVMELCGVLSKVMVEK